MKLRLVLTFVLPLSLAGPADALPMQCTGYGGSGGGSEVARSPSSSGPAVDLGAVALTPAATPAPAATPSAGPAVTGAPRAPAAVTGGCATPVGPFGAAAAPAATPAAAAPAATPAAFVSLADPTSWQTWWSYNRDPLLELRATIERGRVTTGDDDFFIGRGERRGLADAGLRPHTGLVRERVVPELIATLDEATSPAVESEALIALARIGAPPADGDLDELEALLTRYVAHPALQVSESAVLALGILGRPAAVRTLEHDVADCPDGRRLTGRDRVPRRLRSYGADALGLVAQRSEHEEARRYAALRLTAAVDLWSESTDLQVACVTSLGIDPLACRERRVGNPKAARASGSREALVDELLATLDDPRTPWPTRAHTVTALARLCEGAPRELRLAVTDRLIACVRPRSKDPEEVRRSAILALGRLGAASDDELDEAVLQALTRALHHGPQASRNFALVALGQAGGRAGTGERPHAGTAAVRKELTRIAVRSGGMERSWAALALGLLEREVAASGGVPSPETRQALQHLLANERAPSDRAALALALGLATDPAATETLVEAFEDVRDDATRGSIAVGLGLLGDDRAIESLRAVLVESVRRPLLVQECSIGLALLGDRSLVPTLVEELERADDVTSRAVLANALGDVGDQRCVPALLTLLEGATADRIAAARALGRVCDPELLPWNSVLAADVNYLAATETLTSGGAGVLDRR